MEIKLTNEQLALLLDDFDSGIIDYKCYKYRYDNEIGSIIMITPEE